MIGGRIPEPTSSIHLRVIVVAAVDRFYRIFEEALKKGKRERPEKTKEREQ
jgi:hypothetical protein